MKYEVEVTKYNTIWRNPETKELHRLDGPAFECSDGTKCWYVEGKWHRTDGPACEYSNGDKEWWVEGKVHRTDGPALEFSDGTKSWFVEGKYHRTDGPAIECSNGTKYWYVEGMEYSETDFNNLLEKVKLSTKVKPCLGKVVIVDGIEYTLS